MSTKVTKSHIKGDSFKQMSQDDFDTLKFNGKVCDVKFINYDFSNVNLSNIIFDCCEFIDCFIPGSAITSNVLLKDCRFIGCIINGHGFWTDENRDTYLVSTEDLRNEKNK